MGVDKIDKENPLGDLVEQDSAESILQLVVDDAVNGLEDGTPDLFEPMTVDVFKARLIEQGNKPDDVDHLTDFDVLVHDMQTIHARKLNTYLGNMSQSNFVKHYFKLLPYLKPRMKAIDVEIHEPSEMKSIEVQVINSAEELAQIQADEVHGAEVE